MAIEFGVYFEKQILYNCNITNKTKSRLLKPITGDEAVSIDKMSFHFL